MGFYGKTAADLAEETRLRGTRKYRSSRGFLMLMGVNILVLAMAFAVFDIPASVASRSASIGGRAPVSIVGEGFPLLRERSTYDATSYVSMGGSPLTESMAAGALGQYKPSLGRIVMKPGQDGFSYNATLQHEYGHVLLEEELAGYGPRRSALAEYHAVLPATLLSCYVTRSTPRWIVKALYTPAILRVFDAYVLSPEGVYGVEGYCDKNLSEFFAESFRIYLESSVPYREGDTMTSIASDSSIPAVREAMDSISAEQKAMAPVQP